MPAPKDPHSYIIDSKPVAIHRRKPSLIDSRGRPLHSPVRLSFAPFRKLRYSPSDFADKIKDVLANNALALLDASFVKYPLAFCVYDSLLANRIIVTDGVWREIGSWLHKEGNPNSSHIKTVLKKLQGQQDRIEVVTRQPNDELFPLYYLNLLKYRRLAGEDYCNELLNEGKCDPEQLKSKCFERFGERAGGLYYKGYAERNKPNRFVDDEQIIQALYQCLKRKKNTYLFTADTDCAEQFLKLGAYLAHDYMSMHSAVAFAEGKIEDKRGNHTRQFNDNSPFEENVKVDLCYAYEPSKHLPPDPQLLTLSVVTISNDNGRRNKLQLSALDFQIEEGFADLLRMKRATNGLNTDQLGGKNFRIGNIKSTAHAILAILKEPMVTYRGMELSSIDMQYARDSKEAVMFIA